MDLGIGQQSPVGTGNMDIEILEHYSPELRRPVSVAMERGKEDAYRSLFSSGFPFPPQLRFLLADRRGIGRIVDVGANIGQFSVVSGLLGIPTLAIEALPDNFVLLSQTMVRNGLDTVLPLHLAATSEPDLVPFGGFSAWGHVVSREAASILVPGLPLDEVLPMAGFGRPDLIKIDVEGHERQVLTGLQRTIASARPMLLIESNTWTQMNEGYQVLLAEVEALGYRLHLFLEDGRAVRRTSAEIQECCIADYLAVPEDRESSRALPVLVNLGVEARLALLEGELRFGFPHWWHVAQTVDRLQTDLGPLPALGRLRERIRRNSEALTLIAEHGGSMPAWASAT